MYLLYSTLFALAFGAYAPVLAYRLIVRKPFREQLRGRLGRLPSHIQEGALLWVHAVSVGEVNAALPLVQAIRERYPALRIAVSTVTATGNQTAKKRLPEVDRVIYLPFDFPWTVRGVVKALRPRAVVVMETELWPNFLRAVRREGIPIVLANGRISPGSYRGYRLVRRFLRRVLDDICCFGMQTASDAERIVALGADARRVEVTGNVKFDGAVEGEIADAERLSRVLQLAPTDLPFIAGSTHSGEDAIVMDAFARLRAAHPSMVLIVAPRHPERPERVREIEALADERALPCIRRSALAERGRDDAAVIIVDTFGELASAYRLGQIIFVGGSLVPVGGHNVLEAAVYGRPVLFGPHMHNFQAIGDLMRAEECGIEVKGRDDLIRCAEALLESPERYRVLGERARALVLRNRGALARTVEIVERYLAE